MYSIKVTSRGTKEAAPSRPHQLQYLIKLTWEHRYLDIVIIYIRFVHYNFVTVIVQKKASPTLPLGTEVMDIGVKWSVRDTISLSCGFYNI